MGRNHPSKMWSLGKGDSAVLLSTTAWPGPWQGEQCSEKTLSLCLEVQFGRESGKTAGQAEDASRHQDPGGGDEGGGGPCFLGNTKPGKPWRCAEPATSMPLPGLPECPDLNSKNTHGLHTRLRDFEGLKKPANGRLRCPQPFYTSQILMVNIHDCKYHRHPEVTSDHQRD